MTRPLRVLFLHASRDDANEYTVHRRLARHVDARKIQTYFIWQSSTHNPDQHASLQLPAERTWFWDFGRNQSLSPKPNKLQRVIMVLSRLPATLIFLRQKIREIQPDIIYTTQQQYEVTIANIFSRVYRIPHLIHICYYIGPWLGRYTFQIIKRTPYLFGSCEFVRQTGIDAGIPPENIDAMHHMTDIDLYDVPPDRAGVRAEFGWDAQTPLIVSAARLDKDKGFIPLIKAFARVHDEIPEARLLICGEPTPKTTHVQVIYQTVEELGLNETIKFAGFRNDLPRLFMAADLYSQPLKYDASSLVILGAMVARKPIVSVRSGSVPEVVVDGETGLLSDVDDIDALAENILTLLRNPDLAQKMGEAGRARVEKVFGPKVIAQTWLEKLYSRFGSRLLDERGGGASAVSKEAGLRGYRREEG